MMQMIVIKVNDPLLLSQHLLYLTDPGLSPYPHSYLFDLRSPSPLSRPTEIEKKSAVAARNNHTYIDFSNMSNLNIPCIHPQVTAYIPGPCIRARELFGWN